MSDGLGDTGHKDIEDLVPVDKEHLLYDFYTDVVAYCSDFQSCDFYPDKPAYYSCEIRVDNNKTAVVLYSKEKLRELKREYPEEHLKDRIRLNSKQYVEQKMKAREDLQVRFVESINRGKKLNRLFCSNCGCYLNGDVDTCFTCNNPDLVGEDELNI